MIELFALLIFGHALADYPLQATWIATTKNQRDPHPSGYPWYQSLAAHAVIHGGFVGIITGSLWLGLAEVVAHGVTDWAKSEGRYGVNVDQAIHVGTKVIWAALAVWLGTP